MRPSPPIAPASAEEFPSRPITWVVPFAPGGITDTTSRIVAEEMSRTLGQSVLIDNRGGGGGTVGTEQVARAKPDGYTMIYGTQGTMAANVTLRKNLSYDPLTSFLPVHLVGESPNLFVAYHEAPYNSVPEFIAYAKQNPGKVTFSSSGVGTATHLVAELFKTVTGIEMQHVPYRGSAPALNDMIAGRVDVMFDYPVSVGPHVEAGKLKVLATTAPDRLRAFPDVPTMAELGMKDMTTQSWSSIMVPAGTPAPVVDRLAAAAHAALSSERVRTHFEKVGTRPMTLQKAEMIPFIEKEIKRWGDVIERAGGAWRSSRKNAQFPPRADLPRRGQDRRGHRAADHGGDRDRDGERRGRGPADRAEGFRECRQPRRGLAAAELAALGLHAEPELDRARRDGGDDDAERGDDRLRHRGKRQGLRSAARRWRRSRAAPLRPWRG